MIKYNYNYIIWITTCFILIFHTDTINATRFDPHGSLNIKISKEEIKKNKTCKVCHTNNTSLNNQKNLIKKSESKCFFCHNKTPHSGLKEHLGKTFKDEKIACLSCHRPHRYTNKTISYTIPNSSFSFLSKSSEGVYRPTSSPMLSRRCINCHSKEKLK